PPAGGGHVTSRFIESLLAADRPLIMEIKRSDAHGGDLLAGRSIDEAVARYEAAGAPCISVVTGRWFGGDPSMLPQVAALTDRPLLQKDFITRRAQLHAAKRDGASAVLLTAALLPRSSMHGLVVACLSLGLTPFVEGTREEEIDAVPHADRCAIGVNNKDIRERERGPGDIERSVRLLPALMRSGTRCPVSASGIDDPATAARLLGLGFRGLLIGTSLLRSDDLPGWLDDLDARRKRERTPAGGGR